MSKVKSSAMVFLALLAFAGNSIFCRLALRESEIDATSFTVIRLISGAIVLALIFVVKEKRIIPTLRKPTGGFFLCAYAVSFSYAYLNLSAATGALVLFATVQMSMLFVSLIRGHRFNRFEWIGIALGLSGLLVLLAPSASSPNLGGLLLMIAAGVAWAGFTVVGQKSIRPLADTTAGFFIAIPISLLFLLFFLVWSPTQLYASELGVFLAVLSGGLTSGIGYAIWYAVLPQIKPITAAVSQLSVPLIAAILGLTLLSESLTSQFMIASALILGGIFLVIVTDTKSPE